jgi:hypothetical protein
MDKTRIQFTSTNPDKQKSSTLRFNPLENYYELGGVSDSLTSSPSKSDMASPPSALPSEDQFDDSTELLEAYTSRTTTTGVTFEEVSTELALPSTFETSSYS